MAKPTKKQVKKIEKQLAEGKIIAAEKPAKSVSCEGRQPQRTRGCQISDQRTRHEGRKTDREWNGLRCTDEKHEEEIGQNRSLRRIRKRVSRRIRCVNLRFNRGRMPVRVRPIFLPTLAFLRWCQPPPEVLTL